MATRADIRAYVLDALNRKDLTRVADGWVSTAHNRINRTLRHRKMIQGAALSVDGSFATMPDDFIEQKSAFFVGSKSPLLYQPEIEFRRVETATDAPGYYTIHGYKLEIQKSFNTNPRILQLYYYARLPSFSADSASNFFSEEFEHVYQNFALAQGHRFVLEHDIALGYEAMAAAEIENINMTEKTAEIGNGPLVQRPAAQSGRRSGWRFS